MNILIVSYHFFPENTPRAFRAFELAKGFARNGHTVKVVVPNMNYDYRELTDKYGFKVIKAAGIKKRVQGQEAGATKTKTNSFLKKTFKLFYYSVLPSRDANKYNISLIKCLSKLDEDFDLLFSNAYPYSIHLSVIVSSVFNKKIRNAKVKIAEYSDPLTGNISLPKSPLYPLLDRLVATFFDLITVPTHKAAVALNRFKGAKSIHVIPQSIDKEELSLSPFSNNLIPHFAYAGRFYKQIRNPQVLLDYLASVKRPFKFIIYTKYDDPEIIELLHEYKDKLGERLILEKALPRMDVIKELSKMDFLVNIENVSDMQSPSKLIDYAITERPIISFKSANFDATTFEEFLKGNYEKRTKINIDEFYLENIIARFEGIC